MLARTPQADRSRTPEAERSAADGRDAAQVAAQEAAQTTAQTTAQDMVTLLVAVPTVAAAVGTELRDFAAERLNAHGDRLRAWSRVRSPLDFIDVEMRFAAETMGSYADEALHLQDVVRTAFEVVTPPQKS